MNTTQPMPEESVRRVLWSSALRECGEGGFAGDEEWNTKDDILPLLSPYMTDTFLSPSLRIIHEYEYVFQRCSERFLEFGENHLTTSLAKKEYKQAKAAYEYGKTLLRRREQFGLDLENEKEFSFVYLRGPALTTFMVAHSISRVCSAGAQKNEQERIRRECIKNFAQIIREELKTPPLVLAKI